MAVIGCSPGVLLSALVALLVLPAPFFVPDVRPPSPGALEPLKLEALPALTHNASTQRTWLEQTLHEIPLFDIVMTIVLLVLGFFTYICEWIQRKLMERRLVKLNEYLSASVERLRAWERQQAQVEGTLRMVRRATAEYDLLLWLLLRARRDKERPLDAPASTHPQYSVV